jgi:hypothetical protein
MLKQKRVRDKDYLVFVKELPCCVTLSRPVDPHHLRPPGTGMGIKSGDDQVIPLHPEQHRHLHCDPVSEAEWLRERGVEGKFLAECLFQIWKMGTDYGQKVQAAERLVRLQYFGRET